MDIIGRLRGLLGMPGPAPERGEAESETGPDSVEYSDLLPLAVRRERCAIVEFDKGDMAVALAFADELGRFRAGIRAAQRGDRRN